MIYPKKFYKKFYSKSTKIQDYNKNSEINLITYLIIVKISKKFHKLKFISISNMIGNILPHNKLLSKNHPLSLSEKLIFSEI